TSCASARRPAAKQAEPDQDESGQGDDRADDGPQGGAGHEAPRDVAQALQGKDDSGDRDQGTQPYQQHPRRHRHGTSLACAGPWPPAARPGDSRTRPTSARKGTVPCSTPSDSSESACWGGTCTSSTLSRT